VRTEQRLNYAYNIAPVIEIDNDTKMIFFGDVHRGDNSMSDEFAHNQNIYYFALKHYLEHGYSYVEVGDGDELWEHASFRHIRSAHSDVFCLLREFHNKNKFMLLFGNHNMEIKNTHFVEANLYEYEDEFYDEKNSLFPNIQIYESLLLRYKPTGQEFLVVHGHQGDMMNDQLWRISMLSLRYFWRYMHIIGFKNPASPAKNRIKRHKIENVFSRWIEKKQVSIICGHTHRPKFPHKGNCGYFNTGCCIHPRCITGIEIRDGQIMLVDWRIRPKENGELKISKKNIRGPEPIAAFLCGKD